MRIKSPGCTGIFYSSGKALVLGTKDEKSSNLAARKFTKIMKKLNYKDASLTLFKVVNVVATSNVKFSISLQSFSTEHSHSTRYEPELFCGVIFTMMVPRVKLLIYTSGKIVIGGAKNIEQVKEAVNNIYPLLINFKK
eukprot:TRINITY_DN16814_c0_g1_i1.p1 TRINITY_DN16814_c0_g1~~TRINITY_DN16814_c0_g1_i1.p1  ORF type:complete len:138 (-),score=23.30 TRINITY_DN16814_c0_g1_i1:124-537(-)